MVERVLVVGGGIGGLSSAIALTARGVAVEIVEQNPRWDVYGVGIIQPGNAIRALDQLGLIDGALAAGFAMDGDRFHLGDGTVIADNEFPRVLGPDYPGLNGITRPKLHELLTGAVKASSATVKLGVTIAELEPDADGVDVRFSDGSTGRYDVVIGADGLFSLVRRLVFPEVPAPAYTGQAVWRYNLPRPAEVEKLWMYAGRESKAGLVPLAEDLMYLLLIETPGGDAPLRHADADLATVLREKLEGFGGLIPSLIPLITDPAQVVYRPIETIWVPPPWHRGRVVLIGDAAHATSPHVGQGAALAMEDSLVLAEELATRATVDAAFTAFGERRYNRVKTIVDISAQIGQWEIEHNPDGDFVGLTMQSVITTAAPI